MGGSYLSKQHLHLFHWGTSKLSFAELVLRSGYVVVNEFGKLNDSTGSKDTMDFPDKRVPGPCDGRLHVTDMHKIEIIVVERKSHLQVTKLVRSERNSGQGSELRTAKVQFGGQG